MIPKSLPPPNARSSISFWLPLLVVAILCNGLAAGVVKHSGVSMGRFCVMLVIGKTLANWGAWGLFGRRPLFDRISLPFLRAVMFAAVCNGLAWTTYLFAIDRGPLALVQTLTAGYACVTTALAVVFLRERLVRVQVFGVVLVVGASMYVGYVSGGPSHAGSGWDWLMATFAATLLWGATSAVLRYAYCLPHADDMRPFVANWLGLVLTLLPYGLFFAPQEGSSNGGVLAVIGVVLYVIADITLYLAIARGPASVVNALASLYPLPSAAYASIVLGESLERAWIALAMMLPGILLVMPLEQNPIARLLSKASPNAQRT